MLRPLCALVFLLAACEAPEPPVEPDERPFSVMTYNVMCSFCVTEGYDRWRERLPFLHQIIAEHDPDLIGMQELFNFDEVALFLDEHPGYDALFYIDDGDGLFEVYADATLFYRRDRFEALEHGFFWLSDTPDEPFSKGFADGTQLPRLVAWARLQQVTDGRVFFFATTHVDNNSPSQEHSAPLIVERLPADEHPVLLVGDFNSRPNSPAYAILDDEGAFTNAFDVVDEPEVLSNQEPALEYDTSDRIDHIFLRGEGLGAESWLVDVRVFGDNLRPPSDHYPMVAQLRFSP